MFVKRDIVTVYKQTILGPIWFFVQPIATMLTYVIDLYAGDLARHPNAVALDDAWLDRYIKPYFMEHASQYSLWFS